MDIPYEQQFHFRDGTSISTLEQLKSKIESLSYQEFYHHVNVEKNDFASWIKYVIKDEGLAADLQKVTSIVETVEIINDHLHPKPAVEIEPVHEPEHIAPAPVEPHVVTVGKSRDFNIIEQHKPEPKIEPKAAPKIEPKPIKVQPLIEVGAESEWAHAPEKPTIVEPKVLPPEPKIEKFEPKIEPKNLFNIAPPQKPEQRIDDSRLIIKDFMYGLLFGLIIGIILGRILSF